MKYYCLLFMLILVNSYSNAQAYKKFLDKFNKTVKDSTKADSYILYKKIQQDSDYIWSYAKYNMRNIIEEKGACLDSELTVKHGKFVYYQEITAHHSLGKDTSTTDTEFVRVKAGYYLNDKMEGTWLTYFINGSIQSFFYFEDGLQEGLSKSYYDNGSLYIQGNYVHGLMEGDWYTFDRDSSVLTHSQFKHNFQYSYDEFDKHELYNAYPGFGFDKYIYNYLKKRGYPSEKKCIMLDFTITTDGKLIDPEIKIGVNPRLDQSTMDAITSSPKWVPAKMNKKLVAQRISFVFEYDRNDQD